jgi:hypothetical protein
MTYVAPNPKLRMFTCPHCGVLARFYKWGYQNKLNCRPIPESLLSDEIEIKLGQCEHCKELCIWHDDQLVFPNRVVVPFRHRYVACES